MHRTAVLIPFTRFLGDLGAPIEANLKHAQLPRAAIESPDNYVPSQSFYRFVISASRGEGIPDPGFRGGEKYGADCADPSMTALLGRAPTLYRGLLKACEQFNQTITHSAFGLRQASESGETYFFHSPSCKSKNPAIEHISWFGITTLIGMVGIYAGPEWQPSETGLVMDTPPNHLNQG